MNRSAKDHEPSRDLEDRLRALRVQGPSPGLKKQTLEAARRRLQENRHEPSSLEILVQSWRMESLMAAAALLLTAGLLWPGQSMDLSSSRDEAAQAHLSELSQTLGHSSTGRLGTLNAGQSRWTEPGTPMFIDL